jgi:hypothetical protein
MSNRRIAAMNKPFDFLLKVGQAGTAIRLHLQRSCDVATEPQVAAEPTTDGAKTSPPTPVDPNAPTPPTPVDAKAEIDRQIQEQLEALSQKRYKPVWPLLAGSTEIGPDMVDDVFDDLRTRFPQGNQRLDVLVHSGGGDIHSAHNLGLLFRRYATEELNFLIPRWAKSAATLLVCSGNRILMSPVAELGPIDPQITQMIPFEKRMERFSPLSIEATLDLIRNEFKDGEEQLATGLLERLQFPLTLGGFSRALRIGKEYLTRLLTSRMFSKDEVGINTAKRIGESLVEGHSDHGYCIDIDEAREIGLMAETFLAEELELVWGIYKLNKKREALEAEEKKKEMEELLKRIPPGLRLTPKPVPGNDDHELSASCGHFEQGSSSMPLSNDTTKPNEVAIAIQMATEMMRRKGEITLDHIRCIPFLAPHDVESVVDHLIRHCGAEIGQRKVTSAPMLRWERFLRLRKTK